MAECVRWLDSAEQAAWAVFVRAMHALPEALDRQLKRDSGLPHSDYLVLAILSEADERTMTMTQLAVALRYSASRLSRTVTKLEDRGYLRRHRDPSNGRVTLATLTDAGFATLAAAAPGHVGQVRAVLFEQLTPEQVTQFHDIFERILTGPEINTDCPDSAPHGRSQPVHRSSDTA
ncbi:MAG TPA: MarR family transcriptional regulator [Pseudonocardiaceae bacterium]|nr:MarR family transcriptional regulator [Pseudonocardiaceae bacterium]